MASDVKVKIDLTTPTGSVGFGIPLLLASEAEKAITYTECEDLNDVITAGFTNETVTYKTAELLFMQEKRPAKIAVCATTDTAAEWVVSEYNKLKNWRQLILTKSTTSTADEITAVSTAIETLPDKIAFFNVGVNSSDSIVTKSTLERSFVFYGDGVNGAVDVAGLVGATAGLTVGSFTYKNIIVKGVPAISTTNSRKTQIDTNNGCYIEEKAGDLVTSEGKVLSGEYLDIIDCQDWITQQITYRTQKLLNKVDKLPYDNGGISQLENVAYTVLKEAANMGMIVYDADNGGYQFSVNYALREEATETDRAARKYIGGKFSFQLAGAIHNVEITGEIIV